mmetsp:Transcript_107208/g.167455  ORF Transcript_107208/g.167455 Transcript_107208/m.167455 type:complete len:408 (-) Transcript_107208:41-1264(-)
MRGSAVIRRAPGAARSASKNRRPASAPAARRTGKNGSGPIGQGSISYGGIGSGPLPPSSATFGAYGLGVGQDVADKSQTENISLNNLISSDGLCGQCYQSPAQFVPLPPAQGAGKLPQAEIEEVRRNAADVYFDISKTLGYAQFTPGSTEAVCRIYEDREDVREATRIASMSSSHRVPCQRPASAPVRGRQPLATSVPLLQSATFEAPSGPDVTARKARSSKSYLKEHRLMQEAKTNARDLSAKHESSAALYKHLCHMSEANALAEDLGIQTRYRPHKRERPGDKPGDYEVVCHVYEGQKVTEVSLRAFERRFKALQARWNLLALGKSNRENSGREIVVREAGSTSSKAQSASNSRPSTILSEQDQNALQNEIKRVTLETLALANRMYQQVGVFDKRPVSASPFVIH